MKYGELNLGQIEAIVNKLGGIEGVKRFLSGETYIKEVPFKIWRRITLGTFKSIKELLDETMVIDGKLISPLNSAYSIFMETDFPMSQSKEEISLVLMSVSELGFAGSSYDKICEKAKQLGLELCPPEVGPQLRVQYLNQPKDEVLYIAMNPIIDTNSESVILSVRNRDGELHHAASKTNPNFGFPYGNGIWPDYSKFVFCLKK